MAKGKSSASIKITGLENLKKMNCKPSGCGGCGCSGALYGVGFLGALYYFLTTATSLWMGVVGVVKAIFWPGVLAWLALKSLGA
ncbi:MAG: hypothetical protein WCX64_00735 [Candidatus Micrarchaeia archaeon]